MGGVERGLARGPEEKTVRADLDGSRKRDVMTAQSASYGAEAHQVRGFEAKPHLSPVADSPGKD